MPERLPHKMPERPQKPLTYRQGIRQEYMKGLRDAMERQPSKITTMTELSNVYSTIARARAIRAADLRESGENVAEDRQYRALNNKLEKLELRKKELSAKSR